MRVRRVKRVICDQDIFCTVFSVFICALDFQIFLLDAFSVPKLDFLTPEVSRIPTTPNMWSKYSSGFISNSSPEKYAFSSGISNRYFWELVS